VWTYWIVPSGPEPEHEQDGELAEGFGVRGFGPPHGRLVVTLTAGAVSQLHRKLHAAGLRADEVGERVRHSLRSLGCVVARTYLEARALPGAGTPAIVVAVDRSIERLETLAAHPSLPELAVGRRVEPAISITPRPHIEGEREAWAAARVSNLAQLLHAVDDRVVPAVRAVLSAPGDGSAIDALRRALGGVGLIPSVPEAAGAQPLPVPLLNLTLATQALMLRARAVRQPTDGDRLWPLARALADYGLAAVWFDGASSPADI
jgi:hypothetical protein